MRIIRLAVKDLKRIHAVEVTATKNGLIEVCGSNGAGKSTLLDAMAMALEGQPSSADPIRHGAERGSVTVELGGGKGSLIVERVFRKGTRGASEGKLISELKVTNEDGAVYSKPQAMLDDMLGAAAFDPLEFARAKPVERYATLMDVVTLDVDPEQVELQNKELYQQRQVINAQGKAAKAELDILAAELAGKAVPIERESAAGILAELEKAQNHNGYVRSIIGSVETSNNRIADLRKKKAALEASLAECAQRLEAELSEHKQLQHEMDGAVAIELEPITDRLSKLDELNRLYDQAQTAEKKERAVEGFRKQSADATAKMQENRDALAAALEAAKLPIRGLELRAGRQIAYKGVLFDELSTGEQIKVSCAIAMSANPKLRILRVAEGSLLDAAGREILLTWAEKRDYQIWIETVSDINPGNGAIFLTAGEVSAAAEAAH